MHPERVALTNLLNMSLDIAIIGLGFTGALMALALTENGIPCKVYEKAPQFEQPGFGIAMGPNALAALRAISPNIREAYNSIAKSDPDGSDTWLKFRYGMHGSDFGTIIENVKARGVTGEKGRSCVHRRAFLEEITRFIPANVIEFGKELQGFEQLPNAVRLIFKDDTVDVAAVLGCDGINSSVRRMVFRDVDVEPVFSGAYCYRRIAPVREVAQALRSAELANSGTIWCGNNGYITSYGIGKVIANGTEVEHVNIVAVQRTSEAWNPVQPESSRKDMLRDFEGWDSGIVQLLEGIEEPVRKWPLFESKPIPTYYQDRICLLGDAAHASTPHQGSGAGMGIEDVWIMAQLMSNNRHRASILSVFKVFDRLRRKRTQEQVRTAREALDIYALPPRMRPEYLVTIQRLLRHRCNWLWKYDMKKALAEGSATWDEGDETEEENQNY
jgi:salicylate hydroxylase